jgi:hypothetical protein
VRTLVLTTTGRKSGQPRRSAMIYGQDGDSLVVIASLGGARARTAEGDERARLWSVMARIWPNYDVYQTRTERRIPVVILERTP